MPICPFCHRPVSSAFTVWCSCGTNLTKYPNLPNTIEETRPWLSINSPETLIARAEEGSLLEQAKRALIKEQEDAIKKNSRQSYEVAQVRQSFEDFLLSCRQENVAPAFDVGRLRRERFKQQKKTGLTEFPPVKNFKQTPAYFFRILFGRAAEDFYLTETGELYRHQMNLPDPYPIEELLKLATADKIKEGLRQTLVELLKQRQIPFPAQTNREEKTDQLK